MGDGGKGVTFDVSTVLPKAKINAKTCTVASFLMNQKVVKDNSGRVVMNTETPNAVIPPYSNGFVGNLCYSTIASYYFYYCYSLLR